MTKEDRQEVEFYKGNAVQQMIQGDRLTEDEKKVVRAAILTARKDKPNMVLIREANTLLKEIAKTREATEPTVDVEAISPKEILSLEKMKYDQTARSTRIADKEEWRDYAAKHSYKLPLTAMITLFVAKFIYETFIYQEVPLYTFTEAKQICSQQGKVLPNDWNDDNDKVLRQTAQNNIELWSENGGILCNGMSYNRFNGLDRGGENRHGVVCVDENKKELYNITRRY